jgi:hypothetical protein
VAPVALEFLQAFKLRQVRIRQRADRRDQITCSDCFPVIGMHGPQVVRLIEFGAGHACVELHIAFQVMARGYILKITKNFRLLGIAFGPLPFL